MNYLALALSWCLLAQVRGAADPYQPRLEKAPAAKIDLDNAAPPAETRHEPRGRYELSPETDPKPNRVHLDDTEPTSPLAPVEGGPRQKLRPPELLAEALDAAPREGALVGKPLHLTTALARSTDRSQQLKITQAYWRLATAQADYHWAIDHREKLKQFTHAHTNTPAALSARAAARADVRDAQLEVTQSQQDLLDLLHGQADEAPPLAVDRPHVGDYRTYYETIFTSRVPPPRIRLIHRTLPVRRKAIDDHSEAIQATLDALASTGEDFQTSGHGLATVLVMLEQLQQERRAFMADVRDYNQEIAEYAFTVAPPGASDQILVSMLIKTSTGQRGPAQRGTSGSRPAAPAETESDPPAEQPTDDQAPAAEQNTSNYQPAGTADAGVYQGLLDLKPPARVQKLASLLHWDRTLPPDAGQPTPLADCLTNVPPDQRLNVIAAYWQARECAARYQVLSSQLELLNALPAIAIGLRDQPGIAGASVRLQSTRLAAHAALLDAHVALLKSGFALTQAAGRRLDDFWVLPATPPQSGRYHVGAHAEPGASRHLHHWGETIAIEHARLEERADAVIQGDVARAELAIEIRQPPAAGADANPAHQADEPVALDRALRATTQQTTETLAFLHDLTGYNMAIAHYALATLPAGLSSDELVKRLVIARTARGDS